MKFRAALITAAVMLCFISAFLSGCSHKPAPSHAPGLFSWHSDVLDGKECDRLFALMASEGLTELYQYISSDADPETVSAFCRRCADYDIRLFRLIGEPKWGTDPDADELRMELLHTSDIGGFSGVVIDAESWSLDEWDADVYCSAMKKARSLAGRLGLEAIVCVPYWLDKYDGLLESIVRDGCDSLAVMNYYKKNEASHIETEAELCEKYGRPLISIYELQPAGTHGLLEINTYHNDGVDAARDSFDRLREEFPDVGISLAFHEYRSLKEVTEIE